jgi:hypothetical protein
MRPPLIMISAVLAVSIDGFVTVIVSVFPLSDDELLKPDSTAGLSSQV